MTPSVKGEHPLKPKSGVTAQRGRKGPSAASKTARSKRGAPPFEMDPNAKWACDVMSVTREPVWKKKGTVTFDFNIRNEGTANLKIKGKGG